MELIQCVLSSRSRKDMTLSTDMVYITILYPAGPIRIIVPLKKQASSLHCRHVPSNNMQIQRVEENTTATRKYNIDHKCFAVYLFFSTTLGDET